MNTRKSQKAFSLVEILVYMMIVAVLVAMVFVGINLTQVAARNEGRKLVVQEMISAIDSYFRANSAYPVEGTSLSWQTDQVTIGNKVIPLSGYKRYNATTSNMEQTRYAYIRGRSGYIVCVKMETGEWLRSGPGGDALSCPTS